MHRTGQNLVVLPAGWPGGQVAGSNGNNANSASVEVEVEVEVEAELGKMLCVHFVLISKTLLVLGLPDTGRMKGSKKY